MARKRYTNRGQASTLRSLLGTKPQVTDLNKKRYSVAPTVTDQAASPGGITHAKGGISHAKRPSNYHFAPATAKSARIAAERDRKYGVVAGHTASARIAARLEYARRHGLSEHVADWSAEHQAYARRHGLLGQAATGSDQVAALIRRARQRYKSKDLRSSADLALTHVVKAASPVVSGQGGRHPAPALSAGTAKGPAYTTVPRRRRKRYQIG